MCHKFVKCLNSSSNICSSFLFFFFLTCSYCVQYFRGNDGILTEFAVDTSAMLNALELKWTNNNEVFKNTMMKMMFELRLFINICHQI